MPRVVVFFPLIVVVFIFDKSLCIPLIQDMGLSCQKAAVLGTCSWDNNTRECTGCALSTGCL
jgi:hypothetical protein